MGKRVIVAALALILICAAALSGLNEQDGGAAVSTTPYQKKYIIIDAGHGGFDGGAVASDGTLEKDLNLEIALKVDAVLRAAGFHTVLVRDGDVSTEDADSKNKKASDIKNRLKLMEKYENAIFVSIHMNKYETTQPHGAQVFYSPSDGSKLLAECIQRSVCEGVQTDNKRVVKRATKDIYLLYHATVPAVIAECGFLSNPSDLTNLKDREYQLKIAASVAGGIIDYYIETLKITGG